MHKNGINPSDLNHANMMINLRFSYRYYGNPLKEASNKLFFFFRSYESDTTVGVVRP
jgi:hypothetical protein